jgi:hypothetical protein
MALGARGLMLALVKFRRGTKGVGALGDRCNVFVAKGLCHSWLVRQNAGFSLDATGKMPYSYRAVGGDLWPQR